MRLAIEKENVDFKKGVTFIFSDNQMIFES